MMGYRVDVGSLSTESGRERSEVWQSTGAGRLNINMSGSVGLSVRTVAAGSS